MRKIILLVLSVTFLLYSSCEDDKTFVAEFSPKLLSKNVEIKQDGTLWVSFELTSEGKDEIEWIGCNADTVRTPSFQSFQNMAAYKDGNTYYSVYNVADFDSTKTYYFRPFANNVYGVTYGQVMELKNIKSIPVVAPCEIPLNTFEFLESERTINSVTDIRFNGAYYKFQAYAFGMNMDVAFLKSPHNGIYKTTLYEYPDKDNEVRISVNDSFYVLEDANVFVNEIDSATLEITVCDAQHTGGSFGGTYPFNLRVIVNR